MKQHSIPMFRQVTDLYSFIGIQTAPATIAANFSFCNLGDHAVTQQVIAASAHRTTFYTFLFVKNASGRFSLNQQERAVAPGTVCFSHPGDVVQFHFEEVHELYLLTFSESFLNESAHAGITQEFPFLLSEGLPAIKLDMEKFAEFERLYDQVNRVYLTRAPLSNKQIGYLLLLILLKIKETFSYNLKAVYRQNRQTDIVRSFKVLLRQHYQDLYNGHAERVYSARQYADAMGINPNYLNSIIREKTGLPVSKWIIDKTILESKLLLAHSSLSIKEIAYRLGFAEASYFCRYFKRYTQVTAAEFRKSGDDTHTLTGILSPMLAAQTLTA